MKEWMLKMLASKTAKKYHGGRGIKVVKTDCGDDPCKTNCANCAGE